MAIVIVDIESPAAALKTKTATRTHQPTSKTSEKKHCFSITYYLPACCAHTKKTKKKHIHTTKIYLCVFLVRRENKNRCHLNFEKSILVYLHFIFFSITFVRNNEKQKQKQQQKNMCRCICIFKTQALHHLQMHTHHLATCQHLQCSSRCECSAHYPSRLHLAHLEKFLHKSCPHLEVSPYRKWSWWW
jgi:hypothetical protein